MAQLARSQLAFTIFCAVVGGYEDFDIVPEEDFQGISKADDQLTQARSDNPGLDLARALADQRPMLG